MNGKKLRTTVIASALVGCLAIGGISAYFTDGDTVTNSFTVGKVEIELQEPNWNEEDAKDITPGKEMKKDPQVENTGINEAYVFLEVKLPKATVTTADENGNAEAEAYQELFKYNVNEGWIELTGKVDNSEEGFVTKVFAYAASEDEMTAVEAGQTTAKLFDYVKLINLIEGNLEDADLAIDVTAYAIQTANLTDATGNPDLTDGEANTTITDANAIWDIVVNANPATTK